MGCCGNGAGAKGRLTVVMQITHTGDDEPVAIDSRFDCLVDGEPLRRKCVLNEKPRPIDLSWVIAPTRLVIENLAGMVRKTLPTEAEKAVIAGQIVLIGTREQPDLLFICPGQSITVCLMPGHEWFWHAIGGEVPVRLFAV